MNEILEIIAGIEVQLPDIPEPLISTRIEYRAIDTRSMMITTAQLNISWDPETVSQYFETCGRALDEIHAQLKNIRAMARRCRTPDAEQHFQTNLKRRVDKDYKDEDGQRQMLMLQECMHVAMRRWTDITRIQKKWECVRSLNMILIRVAYLNMACIKAEEMAVAGRKNDTEEARKEFTQHLTEMRNMNIITLVDLYDARLWAELEEKDVIKKLTTVIVNLP